jgi:hypothetical protein
MTESETDRQKEIEALLVERRKFEAWLAQLDAKRDTAAAHVFERVHADYTKRLDAVRSRLQDEAGTLRSMVSDLEARLSKEQDRVTKKTDERAEAELRAMVGEFGEKEWNTTRSKLDSSIADLRAKFDATERELAELKELLSSVTGAQAPARASVMIAAAETVAEALHEFATPSAESVEKGETHSGAEVPAAASEAAMGDQAPEPAGAVSVDEAQEPEAAPVAEEPRAPTPFDELAFLRSVAGTPSRPSGNTAIAKGPAAEPPKSSRAAKSASPAPAPAPSPVPEPAAVAAPEPEQQAADEAEPAAAAADDAPAPARASGKGDEAPLGGPTPRTSQAIRSLKCQECGTLNFPTEWYCERCGGELAAF